MSSFAKQQLIQLLGIRIQGDLGPVTIYVSRRHQVVWYDKAPPLEPPSHQQRLQHAKWRSAARSWRYLTQEERGRWTAAVKRCHIPLTGYNLFVGLYTNPDPMALQTIARRANVDLASTLRGF